MQQTFTHNGKQYELMSFSEILTLGLNNKVKVLVTGANNSVFGIFDASITEIDHGDEINPAKVGICRFQDLTEIKKLLDNDESSTQQTFWVYSNIEQESFAVQILKEVSEGSVVENSGTSVTSQPGLKFSENGKHYELMSLEEIQKLEVGDTVKIVSTGSSLENFNILDAKVIEIDLEDEINPARLRFEETGDVEIVKIGQASWCYVDDFGVQRLHAVQILKEVFRTVSCVEAIGATETIENHKLNSDRKTPLAIYEGVLFHVVDTISNLTNAIVLQDIETFEIVVAGSNKVQLLDCKILDKIKNF